MTIGLLTVEIHLPQSRSLKDKRQVLRSVKDRLRAHHNLALCELEDDANVCVFSLVDRICRTHISVGGP